MRRALVLLAVAAVACARGRLVHDGRLDNDALALVRDELPSIRGLAFKARVPALALTPSAIATWLARDIERTYPPGDLERLGVVYARLGLLPSPGTLRPSLEHLYQGQIAAFYDPRTKQLVVATEALDAGGFGVRLLSMVAGRDLVGELLVSHELTHALQDQHWGLPTEAEPIADAQGDRLLARHALLEGDATLAGYAYVRGATPSADTIDKIERELHDVGPTLAREYPDVPEILRAGLAFQYDDGTAFAGWALGNGGWAAVDAAEEDPPQSTEQVLHPARYFGVRDRPLAVKLGGTIALEAASWTRIVEDTLGELGIRVLAGRTGDAARAARIADGWGGDRLRALAHGDDLLLVWMTAWDGPADAEEFFDAAPALLPGARIERRGARVLVILAPDRPGGAARPDLERLATDVWTATRIGGRG